MAMSRADILHAMKEPTRAVLHYDFEQQWREARLLENEGRHAQALEIYESLIADDPDRLYVRLRLSALEQQFNHYGSARGHALQAADTVRRGRWKDLGAVTLRLLSFDERDAVGDLILSADWNDPAVTRDAAVLSQHLWLIDRVEDALRLIDSALAHLPASFQLSYSRANALRYSGRMEEATAEYERCLQLKPDYPYAHWSLAYHTRSEPAAARIERIKRAQASCTAGSPGEPYLHYALFKEFDDAGETDQAWASLMAGAASKRRQLRYDAKVEAEGHASLKSLATTGFVSGQDAGSGRVPIFIVGMPRTGTTLLERILGNHAEVRAGGELNDFNSALSQTSDRFIGTTLSPAMVEQLGALDFARVGQLYMQRTEGKARGSRYLVDKNPANFVHAAFIARALPQARILCLRRSPMDACLSNLKELFSSDAYGYSYDLDELADHYVAFDSLCRHWQDVMPARFHVVDYEELVLDPQRVARDVMRFCGLPYDPDSVDITRNTAPVSTASSSQVRQPINTRGVGAWRKYATQLQPLQARLESMFGPVAT